MNFTEISFNGIEKESLPAYISRLRMYVVSMMKELVQKCNKSEKKEYTTHELELEKSNIKKDYEQLLTNINKLKELVSDPSFYSVYNFERRIVPTNSENIMLGREIGEVFTTFDMIGRFSTINYTMFNNKYVKTMNRLKNITPTNKNNSKNN